MGHLQLIAAGIRKAFADAIFRRDLRTMRALIREVSGICSYLPYSVRAYAVRVRRPPKRVIRYGSLRSSPAGEARASEARKCIDVYSSGDDEKDGEGGEDNAKPLLLFVHGGAWGSGERWHYAPLANALADQNIIVGVCSYPMFPDVLVPEMVEDVRNAVVHFRESFTALKSTKQRRFTVLGHSSGAHLLAMAMLTNRHHGNSTNGLGQHPPDCFIGISGPYDITAHYAYEKYRGVAELSPMRDAMGGPDGFASNSPMMRIPDHNNASLESSASGRLIVPRTFLFDSEDDDVVKAEQSRRFGELLRAAKCPVVNMSYRDVTHAGFVIQTRRRGAPTRRYNHIQPNRRRQKQRWQRQHQWNEIDGEDKFTDTDGSLCQESTEEPIIASASTAPHLTPALRDVVHIVTL